MKMRGEGPLQYGMVKRLLARTRLRHHSANFSLDNTQGLYFTLPPTAHLHVDDWTY